MEEFKQLEQARLRCFRDCNKAGSAITLQSNSEQLQFFLKVIEKDSCIKTCEERVLEMVPWGGIPHHVLRQLKNKDGYNYLQLSMFRVSESKSVRFVSVVVAVTNYYMCQHEDYNVFNFERIKLVGLNLKGR